MVLPGRLLEPLGMSQRQIAAVARSAGGNNSSISEGEATLPGNASSAAVLATLPVIFRLPLYVQLPRSTRLRTPMTFVSRSGSSGRGNGAQRGSSGAYNRTRLAGRKQQAQGTRAVWPLRSPGHRKI